jgi:miniconductance mechanosensitive channel
LATAWADYERVQADIFDDLIAVLPGFERLFQQPLGLDIAQALRDPGNARQASGGLPAPRADEPGALV